MSTLRRLCPAALIAATLVSACGVTSASPTAPGSSPTPSAGGGVSPGPAETTATIPSSGASDAPEAIFTPIPDASQAPDTGSGAAAGDIPDNAVFLTYTSGAWQFSIQYVEGWQVRTVPEGVVIRDKDSSETVSVVPLPADVAAWVQGTDLPALQSTTGFKLIKQNRVMVGSSTFIHIVYHALADPDPVTGKQVPSTIDRFYVPGPALAVISLSTPDGVDNVDAFRQMITSFAWAPR
jgi:hypothetical protein